jgi:hypothetical protein
MGVGTEKTGESNENQDMIRPGQRDGMNGTSVCSELGRTLARKPGSQELKPGSLEALLLCPE